MILMDKSSNRTKMILQIIAVAKLVFEKILKRKRNHVILNYFEDLLKIILKFFSSLLRHIQE